ncbi:MAG: phosphonate C-P lyase system protein PhnG [Brevinematales bacterium]
MSETYSIAINFFPDEAVRNFKEELERFGFKEEKSRTGMIMGKVKDCFDSEFYIGEILVSETYVSFKDKKGYGITTGYSTDRSFILACLDAIEDTEEIELIKIIKEWFNSNIHYYQENVEKEKKMFASTKVNFGLMVEG